MPQNDVIVVDYPALYAAEEELSASQKAIAAALTTLNADLQPLLSSWIGDGGEAYHVQQDKWNASSDDLNATLALMYQAVGTANAQYQLTDNRIASAWQGTSVPS